MAKRLANLWTALRRLKINFNVAGLICIVGDTWCLHFFIKPRFWSWGFEEVAYMDREVGDIGFGPFFIYAWDRTGFNR
jgi:hypothetical protein